MKKSRTEREIQYYSHRLQMLKLMIVYFYSKLPYITVNHFLHNKHILNYYCFIFIFNQIISTMEKQYVYKDKVCRRTIKGTCLRNREAIRGELNGIPDHQLFNYKTSILINNIKANLINKKISVSDSCVYRYLREERENRSANTTNESETTETQPDEKPQDL